MIAKIAYFLLFLAILGAIAYSTAALAKPVISLREHLVRRYAGAVLWPSMFFALLWPLTRQFDGTSALILTAVSVGTTLVADLVVILHSDYRRFRAEATWTGLAMVLKNPRAAGVLFVASGCLFLLFPLVVGVFYFVQDVPSAGFTGNAARLVLIFIIGSGLLVSGLAIPAALSWTSLSTRARDLFLAVQALALIPTALWLSVLLQLDGRMADSGISVSAPVTAVLLVYFAVTVVVPYAVGRRRSTGLRSSLLESERGETLELKRLILTPIGDDDMVDRLSARASHLSELVEDMARDSRELELAIAIRTDNRQWALDVLTPGVNPFYSGTTLLRPQYQQLDATYERLRDAHHDLGDTLIRVLHARHLLQLHQFVNQVLAGMGQPMVAGGTERHDAIADGVATLELEAPSMSGTAVAKPSEFAGRLDLELEEIDRRGETPDHRTLVSTAAVFVFGLVVSITTDLLGDVVRSAGDSIFV